MRLALAPAPALAPRAATAALLLLLAALSSWTAARPTTLSLQRYNVYFALDRTPVSSTLNETVPDSSLIECRAVHDAEDQCQFVQKYCENTGAGIVHYLHLYYCDVSPNLRPVAFGVGSVWLGWLFTAVGISASDYFSPNLGFLARGLRLPEHIAGVTLLALGNGAPDLFTTFSALKAGSAGLALGELIGAASFISSVVVGTMVLIKPFAVDRVQFLRDVLFLIATLLMVVWIAWWKQITAANSQFMIIMYIAYVVSVMLTNLPSALRWQRSSQLQEQLQEQQQQQPTDVVDMARSEYFGVDLATVTDQHDQRHSIPSVSLNGRHPHLQLPTDPLNITGIPHVSSVSPSSVIPRLAITASSDSEHSASDLSVSRNNSGHSLHSGISSHVRVVPISRRSTSSVTSETVRAAAMQVGALQHRKSLLAAVEFQDLIRTLDSVQQNRVGRRGSLITDSTHPLHANTASAAATDSRLTPRRARSISVLKRMGSAGAGSGLSIDIPQNLQPSHPAIHSATVVLSRPSLLPTIPPSPLDTSVDDPLSAIHVMESPDDISSPSSEVAPLAGVIDSTTAPGVIDEGIGEEDVQEIIQTGPVFTVFQAFIPSFADWHSSGVVSRVVIIVTSPAVLALTVTVPVFSLYTSDSIEHLAAEIQARTAEEATAGSTTVGEFTPLLEMHDDCESDSTTPEVSVFASPHSGNQLPADNYGDSDSDNLEHASHSHYRRLGHRLLHIAQAATIPAFISAMFVHLFNLPDEVATTCQCFGIISAIVTAYLLFFSGISRPFVHLPSVLPSAIGFLSCVCWVYLLADEVVSVLQAIGAILNISDAILGLTVLAVGHSLGDLITNTAIARSGFPTMGIAACFGGPLLNILLGLGLSALWMISTQGRPVVIDQVSNTLFISAAGLMMALLVMVIAVSAKNYQLTRTTGVALVMVYCLIMGSNVIIEVWSKRIF
ncbi:hypothetical protein GQ42DRAFT_162944 [Ramicandelaber brevisporus]|nr:hypothetical protein GQ42DRAFT_162944 [Ramicandelaber brevisporus]